MAPNSTEEQKETPMIDESDDGEVNSNEYDESLAHLIYVEKYCITVSLKSLYF